MTIRIKHEDYDMIIEDLSVIKHKLEKLIENIDELNDTIQNARVNENER